LPRACGWGSLTTAGAVYIAIGSAALRCWHYAGALLDVKRDQLSAGRRGAAAAGRADSKVPGTRWPPERCPCRRTGADCPAGGATGSGSGGRVTDGIAASAAVRGRLPWRNVRRQLHGHRPRRVNPVRRGRQLVSRVRPRVTRHPRQERRTWRGRSGAAGQRARTVRGRAAWGDAADQRGCINIRRQLLAPEVGASDERRARAAAARPDSARRLRSARKDDGRSPGAQDSASAPGPRHPSGAPCSATSSAPLRRCSYLGP